MLTRSLWTILAVAGYLLGAVGMVALPTGAVLAWIGLGLLIGALAWIQAQQRSTGGKTPAPGTGPRAKVAAAAVTLASGLVLAGLMVLLGAAGAVVIAMLVAIAALWIRLGRGAPQDYITAESAAADRAEDLRSAAQLLRPARRSCGPRALRGRAHPGAPARRTRTTELRRVYPMARDRRLRGQRSGPLPGHRPVSPALPTAPPAQAPSAEPTAHGTCSTVELAGSVFSQR